MNKHASSITALSLAATLMFSASAAFADDGYPVTVTDQLGREVTISQEPESIVSGYYISTSLIIALDEADELVGVEAKADKRTIYQLSAPEITTLPSVGTAKEFDLEGCAALSPDLVIVPAKLKDTIPALESLGLTVLAVNPEDQALLEEAIALLGAATDNKEDADELLKAMDDGVNALTNALEGVDAPSVYLSGNSDFLNTAGTNMYQNTLLTNAGGQNVAAELSDTYWSTISYEQLLAWDPEYIILASNADYTVEDVLADANLAQCTAVKNGNVYAMPSDIEAWDSPVPASFLGSMWLASVLHPDKVAPADYEKAVVDFYQEFYEFTPDMTAAATADSAQ